jgi:DNA polymerase beta
MNYTPIIISSLETMLMGEKLKKESVSRFKANAYKKAIDAIIRYGEPITSLDDAKGIDGLSAKMLDKIREIMATGALAAAERVKERTDVGGMTELLEIHGIGPAKARSLLESGITSVDGLRKAVAANPKLLTKAQTLGLKYAADAAKRIPRAELEQHEKVLLSRLGGGLDGTIVGSYRRGATTSGDIDMLIRYRGSMADAEKAFHAYVTSLSGYILDTLVSGDKKWMGYVRLGDGVVRRLDLLLTPPDEFAFALLYFTGSDLFNVAFRKHCLTRGYTLNEHEMKPVTTAAAPPAMAREEDIFAFVGLKYVPPTERVNGRQIVAA